jgi:shikimate dehydrogenase
LINMRDNYSLGLTGYPLHHSLSPRMHAAALRDYGLQGKYQLYPVEDAADLHKLLIRLRQGSLQGLNVTIPHKGSILSLLDVLTSTSRAIGAANTIFCRDGQLVGDNTDTAGFLADLDSLGWSQRVDQSHVALVLGSGGAARAVVYALTRSGWQVTIAARRREKAQALLETIQSSEGDGVSTGEIKQLSAIHLGEESLSSIDPAPGLIVNTTPLGMFPHQNASPWPQDLVFPVGAAVYDLVYNPAETALLKVARAGGLRVTNGLGMLVEQAALSFEIWTGMDAPREVMRQAVQEYQTGP